MGGEYAVGLHAPDGTDVYRQYLVGAHGDARSTGAIVSTHLDGRQDKDGQTETQGQNSLCQGEQTYPLTEPVPDDHTGTTKRRLISFTIFHFFSV